MRLIDIDELKGCAIIRPHSRADMKAIESCSEVILHDDIPTAYDIDEKVKQLEGLKDTEQDDSVAEFISTRIWNKAISKAIEIVKGGAE